MYSKTLNPTENGEKRTCGVCGFELNKDDIICPVCGSDPLSTDEEGEEENTVSPSY